MTEFEVATNEVRAVHTACEHGFHSAASIPDLCMCSCSFGWTMRYLCNMYMYCPYCINLGRSSMPDYHCMKLSLHLCIRDFPSCRSALLHA